MSENYIPSPTGWVRDQVAEIHLRDAAWQQAFTEARRKITDQRLGVHRLRAYAMP